MASSSSESVVSDVIDSPPSSPGVAGPSRGRKRSLKPESHKRAVAKSARNKGAAYTSPTSKRAIAKRVVGAPCRDGCFTKVTVDGVNSIFNAFWGIGDYNLQNAYLQKMVIIAPVRRKRTAAAVSQRSHTRTYSVSHNNQRIVVCAAGFLSMHGITRKRMDNAIRKATHTAVPVPDQRGRHVPANKIVGPQADHVREHIRLLPAMSSHYSRAKSPNRKYLDSSLSIVKLYQLYLTWMDENYPQDEKVKQSYYSDVFTGEFNISFEPPKVDTCTTCGLLKTAKENATTDAEKDELEVKLKAHEAEANLAHDYMKKLKKDRDPETRAVCMDLQQILPTPRLHTGVAYYKRKMWTYNFCIHDIKTGKSTMYVWHETVAKRGSSEVASCLKKWLDEEYAKGDFGRLIVISDNCAGQNKNINLVLMYLRELHSNRLTDIDHVYLVPGHSHMACDRNFGNIEIKVSALGVIYTPEDYVNAIRTATREGFPVVKMTQDDFLDFGSLVKHVTKRKAPGSTFKDCKKILLRLAYREGYSLKSDYAFDDNNITQVRLQKGRAAWSRRLFDLSTPTLPKLYTRPLSLTPEKVRDLRYLLALMPSASHPFYQAIFDAHTAGTVDNSSSEEDVDDLDPLWEYERA